MTIRFVLALVIVGLVPAAARAQHQAHQAPSPAAADTPLAQCAQAQPVVQNLLADASARLEAARQTNSPAALRAAVESFDRTLRDVRTQLAACARVEAVDPHSGHAIAAAALPAAALDAHAGHEAQVTGAPGDAPAIEMWLNGYDAAFNAKDLDRLASFYHPDVTIYEGAGVNNGWADYRDRHLGPELKSFEDLQFGHTNRRVQMLGERAAYVTSEYFIKAKMAAARQLDNIGRETLILEKQTDGTWKIRHSHTSRRARPPAK